MKSSAILSFLVLFTCIGMSALCHTKNAESMTEGPQEQLDRFLGQWTFDFGNNAVGWLQVRQEDGYLDADLMWGGGGVFYGLPYVYIADDVLYLGRNPRKATLTKDTQGNATLTRDYPTWIEVKRDGDKINGFYLSPKVTGLGVDSVFIEGTKLPDVPPVPDLKSLKYGKPIQLIENKNDLKGWRLIEDHLANGWSVTDGVLTNNPVQKEGTPPIRYGNLRTEEVFGDFNLKLEVNAPPGSNSGVYLRGMYEVQVADSYERPLTWGGSMGAIFTRILPSVKAEKPAGEWQTLDITLCDRHVTVLLNGTTIINNQPVHGATGGAIQSDVFAPGPIYLQGDHTGISFRNLVLTPIIH
ncbi:DUF1080 domain-containing protein [uncultured Sunxiuqinia sp.]|uniref:3-keto-disaccharide hydrolase n=1 Tax=uncultured Sunxiuqinia sp. TaxID=1573825 RepID=UPI0030D975D2|tara:strand:- start:872 stop:1936 length:1065 start_codon:yes stop_codon:yes gene_type:complete